MKKLITLLAFVFCLNGKAQIIYTIAGNDTTGYRGDGGQAIVSELSGPYVITLDNFGNLYVSDHGNGCVRVVSTSGVIKTIAGAGNCGTGPCGDGGQATDALIGNPFGIALDSWGNLYIASSNIRKVNTAGIITTVVPGIGGFYGDGGPATAASVNDPNGLTFDALGNLYIADAGNSRIRMINTLGIITTVAGNGVGASGDNIPATAARLFSPDDVAIDVDGNLYIADEGENKIRKVSTAGIITTIAGTGSQGTTGDGGQATAATLYRPEYIAIDVTGNLYVNDTQYGTIRKIDTQGIITTVAGCAFCTGTVGDGDGGQATLAGISYPEDIAFDNTGNMYIAENYYSRIRMVTAPLTITVNSPTLCAGNTTTLTANGATSYTWSPTIGLSADTGTVVVANPTVTTIYTINGTSTYTTLGVPFNFIGTTTATTTVPSIIVNTPTICIGDTATLTASGAITYTWNTGVMGATYTTSPTITTTYTVTGIDVNNCTITATPTIIINSLATVTSNTPCAGAQSLYLNCAPSGFVSYNWSGPNSFTSTVQNPIINNVTSASAGIYTLSVVNSTSCVSTSTVSVIINPLPMVTVNSPTVCENQTINLYATGGFIYSWSGPNFFTSSFQNPSIFNATTAMSGNYAVTVTDANGCVNGNLATVIVNTLPTDSFTLVQDILPHTWDTYVVYSSNVSSVTWYWGDGDSTIALYPSHTYSVAGWYNICANATDTAGCTVSYCLNDSLYRVSNNSPLSAMVYVNVLNGTTGISQISGLNSNISIYPNPNNGSFVIEPNNATKQTMQVYDVTGKLVLSQTINGRTSIDASSLNEGIYNISLLSNEGVVNKRLVIVR